MCYILKLLPLNETKQLYGAVCYIMCYVMNVIAWIKTILKKICNISKEFITGGG
jgi:hypothetical protein